MTETRLRELFECCKEDGQDFETFVREQMSNLSEVEAAKARALADRLLAARVQQDLNKKTSGASKPKLGPLDYFFRKSKSSSPDDAGTSASAPSAPVAAAE
jgi:hypothetical protein